MADILTFSSSKSTGVTNDNKSLSKVMSLSQHAHYAVFINVVL